MTSEETDLRQAIQSLATQANVSVTVDELVGGVATAVIEDEPFEAALQKILLPLGFVWTKKDGQYLIGTTDPQSSLFRYLSQKLDYHPKHYTSEELLAVLPEAMQQYVRVVGKRDLIVIDAPQNLAADIVSELDHADQPVPQVVLEAIVAVYSPETSYQQGIDLQHIINSASNSNGLNLGFSGLALSGAVNPAAAAHLFSNFSITSYFIRMLAQ